MYCRECSKELNDENWAESLRKKNSKICKDCLSHLAYNDLAMNLSRKKAVRLSNKIN